MPLVARVFVTRKLVGQALERLARAGHRVDLWEAREPPPRADLIARAQQADALLCTLPDPIDAVFLDACPQLKVISSCAVGTDNVDLQAARARGIPVGNTPGVLTDATADLAFALLLAAARRLPQTSAAVLAGEWGPWEPAGFLGHDVAGATLGIVGAGRIGTAVARRAQGFGMEVLTTTSRGGTPLATLLERSDFLSLHVPLTPQTRALIGARQLARMRPTAILVNTARGPVVDTPALIDALHAGEIAGAALDVTDPEPLPADHKILALPNVIVTCHTAANSNESYVDCQTHAAREVARVLSGKPPTTEVKDPWLLAEAQDQGFGGV
jgi:glyoxylate reductase